MQMNKPGKMRNSISQTRKRKALSRFFFLSALTACLFAAPLPSTPTASAEQYNEVFDNLPENDQPTVSADSSSYNEETGRYTLTGHVRIIHGERIISTDLAQVCPKTLEIWTQGSTTLTEGELLFTGDAMYADGNERAAWFFGTRVGMARPGLNIRADTMSYRWKDRLVSFDGHVLVSQNGKAHAYDHITFSLAKNRIEP